MEINLSRLDSFDSRLSCAQAVVEFRVPMAMPPVAPKAGSAEKFSIDRNVGRP